MDFARRIASLRITALIAIGASAVLTVDHLKPGRAFCPLAEACAAARESSLGSLMGVPTSVLGMVAFGVLLLISLLPLELSRPILRPAGGLAALAGLGFIAFQEFVLGTYCPLCLVADGAGFCAGLLTLTWPRLPVRRSGRRIRWEGGGSRAAWSLACALTAVVPFALPRPQEPGWEAITPLDEAAFRIESATDELRPVPSAEPLAAAPVIARRPATQRPPPETFSPAPGVPERLAVAAPQGLIADALPDLPRAETLLPEPAMVAPFPPARVPVSEPAGVSREASEPAALAPSPATESTPPLLVEYLNAFCPHCRATHHRLDRVLKTDGRAFRRRRIYTWAGAEAPLWARACAFAESYGVEERVFAQLLQARRPSLEEICAAVRRAGLDVGALQEWLRRPRVAPRLVRDRALVERAGIRRLPTLDIGRRRLVGEQSEQELRAAVRAARP